MNGEHQKTTVAEVKNDATRIDENPDANAIIEALDYLSDFEIPSLNRGETLLDEDQAYDMATEEIIEALEDIESYNELPDFFDPAVEAMATDLIAQSEEVKKKAERRRFERTHQYP